MPDFWRIGFATLARPNCGGYAVAESIIESNVG
jgi:hypothetical protein